MKGAARSTAAPRGAARGLLTGFSALVFVFFYAPIVVLFVFSFNDSNSISQWAGFTNDWYGRALHNANVTSAMSVSIRVAIISTVVSVVLGTLSALTLERYRWRGRMVFDAVLYLPIIIPDVAMAVMLLLFFSKASDLISTIPGIDTRSGIDSLVLSHVAFNISFVSVVVRARIADMDPSIEEAAADLYANRWKTFWRVTLPQITPGIIGGALLALTTSFDDVVISSFVAALGSTTLPVYVFGLLRKDVTPLINAVSMIILAISVALVALSLIAQKTVSRSD